MSKWTAETYVHLMSGMNWDLPILSTHCHPDQVLIHEGRGTFTPRAFAAVLEWAAKNPGKAAALATRIK